MLYLEGTRELNSGTGVNAAGFVIKRVAVSTKFVFDRSPVNTAGTSYPMKSGSSLAVEMIGEVPEGPLPYEFYTGVYDQKLVGEVILDSPGTLPFR